MRRSCKFLPITFYCLEFYCSFHTPLSKKVKKWLSAVGFYFYFTFCPFSITQPKYRTKSQNRILHETSSIILNMYKTLVAESRLINSLFSLHFLHGVSISHWILPYPLHHLPLYLHGIEDMQETQNQEFQFKATSREICTNLLVLYPITP